jgi:hypothetical protein
MDAEDIVGLGAPRQPLDKRDGHVRENSLPKAHTTPVSYRSVDCNQRRRVRKSEAVFRELAFASG